MFEPGSVGVHVALRHYGSVTFIRILTVEEVNAPTSTELEESRPHTVQPAVQNFRIGAPQVLVLEAERLNR